MIFVYILYYVIFPMLVIYGVKHSEKKRILLESSDSNYIKGVAACFVVLAHCENYLEELGADGIIGLKPYSVLGGIGVLLFFFLSGYGLYKGYIDRMPGVFYWKKRIINTYLPTVIIEICFLIINMVIGQNYEIKDCCYMVFISQWFIDVIMVEYTIFFLARRVCKSNHLFMIGLNVLLSCFVATIFWKMGLEARWYNGLLLFPFGMIVANKEATILEYFEKEHKIVFATIKGNVLLMGVAGILFIFSGAVFTMFKGVLWADFVKTFSGMLLSLLFVAVVYTFLLGNSIIIAIGKRSLYVYLIHLGILEIFNLYLVEKIEFWGKYPGASVLMIVFLSAIFVELAYRLSLLIIKKRN